jgi:YidC/Oxa1 family membrane protein insertase
MQSEGNSKNLILAISLSMAVIFGWNYFYGMPQAERQRQNAAKQQTTEQGAPSPAGTAAATKGSDGVTLAAPKTEAAALKDRATVIGASPRVRIETPSLLGSIDLKGARLDDLLLRNYRETVDPKSANIVLFSPEGAADAYYADFGWIGQPDSKIALPNADTVWTSSADTLRPGAPVTLTWDNGQGLVFTRKVSVDDNFLFTIDSSIANKGTEPVTVYPYGLLSRHGTPHTLGYYILHEGLIGVIGEHGLQEITYAKAEKEKTHSFKGNDGWIGITDKYWAAAILPEQGKPFDARFSAGGKQPIYQADILRGPETIAPGASVTVNERLFAGAKEANVISTYDKTLGVKNFDLLIDWGWFWFITKPMFWLMTEIFKIVGNFGVTILLLTVIIKGLFFPLANKSYASMAKMKAVQPEMAAIRERFPDDKAAQQKALMELYKTEKINPLAGCLPIVIQIPVFFALYKVLFVTIEMRHAPFFGWIKDLAAPDPTSIFNLFGLLPIHLPDISYFHLGVWPIIMGITMWFQMKMNPEPPDPVQKKIFAWMPVIFTFMLGTFPAGLVIYWAWNNTLSVAQQYLIMKRSGVKVELWDNLRKVFRRTPKPAS